MLKKSTLFWLGTKISFMQKLEDSMQRTLVLTQGSTEHQNIIKVYNYKVVKKVKKYTNHQKSKVNIELYNLKAIKTHLNRSKYIKKADYS